MGSQGEANTFTYAGEEDAANKVVPGTKGARSVVFVGEPNAGGDELTGER